MIKKTNRSAALDFQRSSLCDDRLLGLLSRAGGKFVKHADRLQTEEVVVPLNSNLEMRSAMQGGFGVERVETLPDGTARAHLSRVAGLLYPS